MCTSLSESWIFVVCYFVIPDIKTILTCLMLVGLLFFVLVNISDIVQRNGRVSGL